MTAPLPTRPPHAAGGLTTTVLAIAVVVAVVLAGLLAPPTTHAHALEPPPNGPIEFSPLPGWPSVDDLEADAFVLVEAATGQVLAGRNAELRRPVASTVKVLTALTALQRVDPDEQVTVGEEVAEVGGAGVGLASGDTWTVIDLVTASIARSGNEAATALAVHVGGSVEGFVALMREDAAALGLNGVSLVDPTGLDDDNLLSASDLVTITRAALDDPVLRGVLQQELVALPSEGVVRSRNLLLGEYPGATGAKTGYTAAAGYSLIGSADRGERELIAVVLGMGDDPARFVAATRLLDLGYDGFARIALGAVLELAVAGGHALIEVAPVTVSLPAGETARLALPLPVRVPDGDLLVPIEHDGVELGAVPATVSRPDAGTPAGPGSVVGRSAVDGAYAALRAAAASGVLR